MEIANNNNKVILRTAILRNSQSKSEVHSLVSQAKKAGNRAIKHTELLKSETDLKIHSYFEEI